MIAPGCAPKAPIGGTHERCYAVTRREEFALTKEHLNRRTEAALRPLNDRFADQLARQQSFVSRFRFLSPALLWQDYFYPRIAARQLLASSEFAEIPRYEYQEESVAAVGRRAIIPLLGALALALLIIVFSLRAYRHHQLFR